MEVLDHTVADQQLSATDYAIITCNSNEVITSWDERAEKIFGWSAKEACGQNTMYLLLPPTVEAIPPLSLKDIILTGKQKGSEQFSLSQKVQHKDGTTFDAHLLVFSVEMSDSIIILARNLEKQQRSLNKINTALQHQTILDDLLKISVRPVPLTHQLELILEYLFKIPSLCLIPRGAVFLTEEGSDKFQLKAQRGLEEKSVLHCRALPQGMCHCGQIAQYETYKESRCSQLENRGGCRYSDPHGHYCAPILKSDKVVGILCLYLQNDTVYPKETEQLLLSICNILAGMVEYSEMDIQLVNLVHDLRNSINKIREEKKFSESIIQGLTHGLIVTDLKGNIRTSNPVAERILDADSIDLHKENLGVLLGNDVAKRLLNPEKPENDVDENEMEVAIKNIKGDKKIVGYSTVSRVDALGREVGRIISLNDLTELKYVRREMEKINHLANIAEIASAVAHEVRNPLAGIKLMAQSIEKQTISQEEQSECLTRIIRQVDRLNGLLTEFFSYARPPEAQVRASSLHDIIAETKPLIAERMKKNHILFRESYDVNIPLIYADPNQVQQVLLNLFLNSLDAIQQGGIIKLHTSFLQGKEHAHQRKMHPGIIPKSACVQLTISDNGAGMPEEVAKEAFEPFFTTKSDGSGLGLAIVYRTLRQNNASITVESKPGQGTSFTIYFSIEE